jgi:hypothetical protein
MENAFRVAFLVQVASATGFTLIAKLEMESTSDSVVGYPQV